MDLNLSFVKETIEINRGELVGNRALTNELLVDDIMLALGYNKKRNTGVKRIYGFDLDWEVCIDEHNRFVVKTVGYGDDILNGINDTAKAIRNFDLIIVTNGERMAIYNLNMNEEDPILNINIFDETDTVNDVLTHISMSNYSVEKLGELYEASLLTAEKLTEIMRENVDIIVIALLGVGGIAESDRNRQFIKEWVSKLGEADEMTQGSSGITVDGLNTKVINLQDKVNELGDEREYHLRTIKELTNVVNTGGDNGDDKDRLIGEFRTKVSTLMGEHSLLRSTIKDLEEEVRNLKSSAIEKKVSINDGAKALLASITDNEDTDRAYVAVINNKLFQNENLHRFIGTCIEELYDIVSVKLMPILFDGDVYRLTQPSKRRDFSINNKLYDLSIDELSEDEALSKLVKLFNRFDGVILECKMIGTKREEYVETVDNKVEINTVHTEDDKDNEIDVEDGMGNDTNIGDDISFDGDIIVSGGDETQAGEVGQVERLIAVPLCNLSNVAWAEGVQLNTVEYVGKYDTEVYKVEDNINKNDNYIPAMLGKTIDSILSMCDTFSESIAELRQVDLSKISKYIEVINSENKNNTRVSFTKFVITEIDGVNKFAPIINGIAAAIKINTEEVKIYIRGLFSNDSVAMKYVVNEESIKLGSNTEFENTDSSDKRALALISGTIVDNIMLTKNSLALQANIFEKCVAVKTNYMTQKIDSEADLITVFTKIIEQGLNEGNEIDTHAVGKVLDSEHMIISESTVNVASTFITFNVRGKAYFVTKMEEWQLMYALIKLQSVICKNKGIGLNVKVSVEAYDFYMNEFKIYEPSLKLAVRSIVEYIKDRVKYY